MIASFGEAINRANRFTLRLVLSQLKRALELKPFSKAYREIYDTYAPLSAAFSSHTY